MVALLPYEDSDRSFGTISPSCCAGGRHTLHCCAELHRLALPRSQVHTKDATQSLPRFFNLFRSKMMQSTGRNSARNQFWQPLRQVTIACSGVVSTRLNSVSSRASDLHLFRLNPYLPSEFPSCDASSTDILRWVGSLASMIRGMAISDKSPKTTRAT